MDEFLLVFLGEKTFNSVNVSELVKSCLGDSFGVAAESQILVYQHSKVTNLVSCNGWCMDPIAVQRTQKTDVKSSTLYLDSGRQTNGLETGKQESGVERRGKVLGQGRKAGSNYQEADESGTGEVGTGNAGRRTLERLAWQRTI